MSAVTKMLGFKGPKMPTPQRQPDQVDEQMAARNAAMAERKRSRTQGRASTNLSDYSSGILGM